MLKFYKKATLILFFLAGALSTIGLFCYHVSWLEIELLPSHKRDNDWALETGIASEVSQASLSNPANAHDVRYFEYLLANDTQFPVTLFDLLFRPEKKDRGLFNLSIFSRLRVHIKCEPESILSLSLVGAEDITIAEGGVKSYPPTAHFACFQHWQTVSLNLENFRAPDWRHANSSPQSIDHRSSLSSNIEGLRLNNVKSTLSSTPQSLALKSVIFAGRRSIYFYSFSGILIISIASYVGFFIYFYPNASTKRADPTLTSRATSRETIAKDQQLPILRSHKLKEKVNILVYLSTEYKNPELSLDSLIYTLGINRTKINNILKSETGQTFTAYLNKLRLTEAARLLLENTEASISEIAYSVGYNNASYFNRVFKREYGCTPVNFRQSRSKQGA